MVQDNFACKNAEKISKIHNELWHYGVGLHLFDADWQDVINHLSFKKIQLLQKKSTKAN